MKVCAIIFLTFAIAAPAAAQPGNWKWEVTVDVFEGVIEGFFSDFKDLKSCANDTVTAYDEIHSAIGLIEQKTASSVLQGIKDLGTALQALKDGLTDCKAAYGEIEQFVKGFQQFKSPLSFAFHVGKDLLVNGKDIYSEITQAVTLWQQQSYLDAGQQIGKALYKLVVGDKWRHYALTSSLPEDPTPKSKCALKCTAEAIGVYWACAGACIAKQAPNSCILDGCPAAVTAFDVPCLKACPKNETTIPAPKASLKPKVEYNAQFEGLKMAWTGMMKGQVAGGCSKPGACGIGYQGCCFGAGHSGDACKCKLIDGSGNVGTECSGTDKAGACGVAYTACCLGYKAKGDPCTCDVEMP